jgi:hypothetical protein
MVHKVVPPDALPEWVRTLFASNPRSADLWTGDDQGVYYTWTRGDAYFSKHPPTLVRGERVWYDDNPGHVEMANADRVTVKWDTGSTTVVDRSDLLTDAEYHRAD